MIDRIGGRVAVSAIHQGLGAGAAAEANSRTTSSELGRNPGLHLVRPAHRGIRRPCAPAHACEGQAVQFDLPFWEGFGHFDVIHVARDGRRHSVSGVAPLKRGCWTQRLQPPSLANGRLFMDFHRSRQRDAVRCASLYAHASTPRTGAANARRSGSMSAPVQSTVAERSGARTASRTQTLCPSRRARRGAGAAEVRSEFGQAGRASDALSDFEIAAGWPGPSSMHPPARFPYFTSRRTVAYSAVRGRAAATPGDDLFDARVQPASSRPLRSRLPQLPHSGACAPCRRA